MISEKKNKMCASVVVIVCFFFLEKIKKDKNIQTNKKTKDTVFANSVHFFLFKNKIKIINY